MIEWQDRALVLSVRPFGDTDALATLLTQDHGAVAGLIKGGQSRRRQADLQVASLGVASWRARLEEQLGQFTFDCDRAPANLVLEDRARLSAIKSLCAMAAQTLSEREPVPALYKAMSTWLDHLEEPYWAELYVRVELGLLATLGFSVDLERCALGGDANALSHVSPKTGRAVSARVAEAYLPKLLALPAFLGGCDDLGAGEVHAGLTLTGTLLAAHVFAPINKDLPEGRHRLAELFIPKQTQ